MREPEGVTTVYDAGTGRSGYFRITKKHKKDMENNKNKTDNSALAKHNGLYHPEKTGDSYIYALDPNNVE